MSSMKKRIEKPSKSGIIPLEYTHKKMCNSKGYIGSNIQKLYLSASLDLYDRRIVAFKIGDSNNNEFVFSTFDDAVRVNPNANQIFHSGHGF